MPNNPENPVQPTVIARPKTAFEKLIDLWKVANWKILAVGCAIVLFLIILLNYFEIIDLSKYFSPLSFLPTKNQIIARIDGEKIYPEELEAAKGLFAAFRNKNADDREIKKEALDFVIGRRLLEEEAKRRTIDVTDKVEGRFINSIAQYGSEQNLEGSLKTKASVYKNYLTYQAIKEILEPVATQWRVINYLTIRYLWNKNLGQEEKDFKAIASEKIEKYHQKIQGGLDIKEAIKQRCQDPEIDYLPFEYQGLNHIKIYSETFNGEICKEQDVNVKASKDTGTIFGDNFLKEILKYRKGEISPVIDFSKDGLGIFAIVQVLDESPGEAFSIEDLVNDLRKEGDIKIYE